MYALVLLAGLLVVLGWANCAAAGVPPLELDEARIAEVAGWLPDHPTALGRPVSDEAAWRPVRDLLHLAGEIRAAEALLKEPIPPKPEDLFMDFFKTGRRVAWERVDSIWRSRLSTLALAECVENGGRFLPALEEIILAFCNEETWMMPAHRPALENFRGERNDIDLKAADVGHNLALIDHVLGERLRPEVRERLRHEVRRRIIDPYRGMILGDREPCFWLMATHNWNAVCIAGVTGATLALEEDRMARARCVVAAETYTKRFLSGFTDDGYCSEGVGYWGYGFGHFILLTEVVFQATGGMVDLLAQPEALAPARYAGLAEIQNGVHPPFADCAVNARPNPAYMYYVNRRLGLGFTKWNELTPSDYGRFIPMTLMFAFPNAADAVEPAPAVTRLGLRTWFPDAGVLICRPGETGRMAVAMKGGHNAEHHNHHDVGSYLVVVGDTVPLVDPGAEVYTQRTFSSHRYESDVLNSFGHAVPRVAGKLQRGGMDAKGEIVATSFSDEEDRLEIEMASAYDVPALESLRRTFTYEREGAGGFTVTDRVRFDSEQDFETALVTYGGWLQRDDGTLVVYDLDEAVEIRVAVKGGEVSCEAAELTADVRAPSQPTRIAIRMGAPVREASITVSVTPMNLDASTALVNGGFEDGVLGWRLADEGIASITKDHAASGECSLLIDDTEEARGSNVLSRKVSVAPETAMRLTGKLLPLGGSGVGVYVQYLDEAGNLLNELNEQRYYEALLVLGGDSGEWESFEAPFTTPVGCTHVRLWIHSINAARVKACLDDLAFSSR